jgi:stage II sporulation protein GA (sporulation sigma-E factor processing peptidase)
LYLEVYPDIVFILNFLIDFILLILLKKINKKKSSFKRLTGSAAAGALFAALLSIFPWLHPIIRFVLMNIAAAAIMVLLAFGRMKKADFMKQVITLYLITYFAGGLINSIYYYTNLRLTLIQVGNTIFSNLSWLFVMAVMLLLIPAAILLLWLLRWYKAGSPETYEVELFFNDRSIQTKGLLDTGNCLYDPIFKKPVMVIENTLLGNLLSTEFLGFMDKAKLYMEGNVSAEQSLNTGRDYLNRLRFIPYQSVGKTQGMMLGLMLDKVLIHTGKETICNEKVTAAICDNHLSTKDDYHVILHKELL